MLIVGPVQSRGRSGIPSWTSVSDPLRRAGGRPLSHPPRISESDRGAKGPDQDMPEYWGWRRTSWSPLRDQKLGTRRWSAPLDGGLWCTRAQLAQARVLEKTVLFTRSKRQSPHASVRPLLKQSAGRLHGPWSGKVGLL